MEKPGYYVYYSTTSSFSPKEKKALYDLYGRDFFTKDEDKDLSEEQVQRILSRVKPAMKKWLNTHDLLPFLKRHHVLTDSELGLLNSSTLARREQAIRLAESLMNKGSYGIATFYLSLAESSECLPAHYQLAGELKQIVHAEYGVVDEDPPSVDDSSMVTTSSTDPSQSLQFSLQKLRGIKLARPTVEALLGNLGLSPDDFHSVPSSLERVCSLWIARETNPFIDDLIQALVLTKTTGRYASLICYAKEKSESPGVRNFFLTLGGQWELVADYLGYTREEVQQILQRFPDSIENQVADFLEMWQLPSTGQLSLPLLHKLKALSGITTEPSQSRKLADRKDVPSYVYMNKRLKTDAAGIPHRSLDSYQHSSPRAPAFKAPYNSFTSSGSPSPPTSSPPKPPRSYSSNSNYTRASSYTNPNSRTSQESRENYNSRSLDSHGSRSLDSSSNHYNRPGTSSSYYGNETIATFSLRITAGSTETPRRPPPPPPPTNSPGLHDPSGHEVDIYSSDPTRTQPSSTGPRILVMFFTGGDSPDGEMYGHAERSYDRADEVPVIEELPDDYPMEIIDNQSADGSSLPPLSDGRSSPAEELNSLDDIGDHNDLNDPGDHSEQAAMNTLNDLNACTPPSFNSQSPVHTSQQEKNSLPVATPPAATAPDNTSATLTLCNPPKVASNEAVPSAEDQVAPVISSPTVHKSDDDGKPLPLTVPPATLSDPATITPVSNPSAIFSNTRAPLALDDQSEAGLSTVDTTAKKHLVHVTSSPIGHTSDDSDEPLPIAVPPASLSAPAAITPMSNPSTTFRNTPDPSTLVDQGEAGLSTDDSGEPLPPIVPPATLSAIPATIIPMSNPPATSDDTSAPPTLNGQGETASFTVGPSGEAQIVPMNSSPIGYTFHHDNQSSVQPTASIPADPSAIIPLPHPSATSVDIPVPLTFSGQGETLHTVGHSAEDELALSNSSPTTLSLTDHDNKSSPLAVSAATKSDIPTRIPVAPPSPLLATSHNMHVPAGPTLSDQDEPGLSVVGSAAENESASMSASPVKQQRLIAEDVHSSTYPPSTTISEREAVTSSEISSSVPGLPVVRTKEAVVRAELYDDAQKQPTETEPKINNFTHHEEPRSFKVDGGAVQHETPVISDLQAPDRRYHSRARLDSLEDRNNLDTDSEMQQSYSESEKESDTEDYPASRPTRKRLRRSRRSSTSISSSEDERDPFSDPKNDLSTVSSPEHELPHDGGSFGVSLSVGEGTVKKHKEQSMLNDLSSQIPPQKLDTSMTGNLSECTDKYTSRDFHEGATAHVDSSLTLPELIEPIKIGLFDEDQHQGGLQSRNSPRMDDITLLHTTQPNPLLSEKEKHTEEGLLKPEVVVSKGERYQSLSDPGLSFQHQHSECMPSNEEELMRTEPTNQVTRTSDPVLESTSSSSDQLQLPVRKSFSSLPPSVPPSLDRVDYLPKQPTPPVSLSAPSTGLHSMLDQPPPPFTHYAAPPPIFRAHVFEQRSDPVYSGGGVEDMDVGDATSQGGVEEIESVMDIEQSHSSARIGMEDITGQRPMQDSLHSMPAHHSLYGRSTSSTSHFNSSLDIPPMVSSSQAVERNFVTRQLTQPPRQCLSQDIVQALEDPNGAEVLFALLESGANVTLPTKDGEYAVHIAVRVENGLEKLKLLLLQGKANRNVTRAVDLRTPLHLACLKADLEMVQLLLDGEEADPNPQDSHGFTPLHYRQTLENSEITKCLINRGAAVDIPSKDGFITPLLVCCVLGSSTFDAAKLLVQSNANVNGVAQALTKPLVAASAVGYEAMVQLLLENDADINIMDQDQCTALLKACQNKHVSVAKRLCQRNFVDVNAPNKDNVTPLMAAVSNNAQDLVVILILNGAYHDVSRIARVSLPGGEEREFEITPMADAAVRGYLEIIEVIVENGGQINAINERALPPITGAILAGQVNVVEFFTKQNDLDCSLEGLMQPFIMAVRCGNQLGAELIIERYPGGIDMMLRSASDQGSEELVQCIETFQQLSLESPAEPPLVLLQPGQLPWDQKPELKGEDIVSKILNIVQSVDSKVWVCEGNEAGRSLEEEQCHSDQTNTMEIQHHQTLVSSGLPLHVTTSVPQSSAVSFVPASLAETGDIGDTTTVTVVSKVGPGMPHEFSSQRLGATDQEVLSQEDDDELNQFDDDTSCDGSESVQVLHVDDPRLAFGQSVYVGRRDTEQFTYSLSQRPEGRSVASHEILSSGVGRMSTSAAGSVYTSLSSLSGGLQVSPSDSSSRKQPLAPESVLPLSAAAVGSLPGPPPVSASSATPSSYLGTQHLQQRLLQTPSVAQSVPASIPFGSSHAPVSSLGMSASMPPLRARAVDEERANEPGAGLSEEDRSLFAPRPKSPPPKATPPSPVHPSPISLQTPTSMASSVVEVLHEFAQITISAALGQSNQEAIIDSAIGSEFEHVATFFLNYFYSPAEFARGGNLVSEFIGGTPSPLNFLLVNELVTKANFKQLLSEMGRKGFVEQLTMVLHQFPGSDYLPWSEEEMLTALFTRAFSIGSLHPSMTSSSKPLPSSLGTSTDPPSSGVQGGDRESLPIPHEPARSDSPPPPKPVSGPSTEKQHTFPETGGHKLGHGSADVARVNNPRNIVTPSAAPSKSTVSPSSTGTTGTIGDTTSTKQQQHERDDGPLIKKPKLTASHESLNSTVSSGQQVSVHSSSSERWGQQESDSRLDVRKARLTASHESLNSTASSGQQVSVHSGSNERWGQQDSDSHLHARKPKLTASHESLSSTASSGQQSRVSAGGERWSAPLGMPNTVVKFGNEVERPLRHVENQASKLPSSQTSSIKLEEGDANEMNDLDRTTPTDERVPLPPGPIGVPLAATLVNNSAIHEHGDIKYQPMVGEHSEQQQLGDEPYLKVPLPSPMDWQATPSSLKAQMHTESHKVEPSKQNKLDEDDINDLDSDDDTHIPGGPAFDIIDNVSLSMARRREQSEHPPIAPSMVAHPNTERVLHQTELSSESLPPLAPEHPLSSDPTSTPGFMQSLTTDLMPSKPDLPGSLKSMYGTADVRTTDLLQETSTTTSMFDLAKQMKSDFVQPLQLNDSPKLERKEQAGDELNDISLVKQHDKTDSKQIEDRHKAKFDETLLKLQPVKHPEYKLDTNEQSFAESEGAMVVQDHQNQTDEQSKSSAGSSPLSQGSQQLKSSPLTPQHSTGSSSMSHKSSFTSDTVSMLQLSDVVKLKVYDPQSGKSTDSATPRLQQQDTSERRFDLSTLHGSRNLEDSDSTDTETDEESRVSLIPPSWSLTRAKEKKPRVHPDVKHGSTVPTDRENNQLTSSTSSGFVEISTGGAWNKNVEQTKTSGKALSEDSRPRSHVSALQQPGRPKTHKQVAAVDDAKRKTDPVPKKKQARPSLEKSATPLTHHAMPKSKVSSTSSTTRLKTTVTSAGTKKLTAASKTTPGEKKTHSTPSSSQSPVLTKMGTGVSKKAPISSPSLRHKQQLALPKPPPKVPATNMTERRKLLMHQRTPKSSMTPPSTKKSSTSAQMLELQKGMKGEVNISGTKGHEKVDKAKPGISITSAEIHKEKPVSVSEDEQIVHTKTATHQFESDYSLTSVGSGASAVDSESSPLPWTVSILLIAKNTEHIFGIRIPNMVIRGGMEDELLETVAMRVNKWKMLGRYLGVDDDSLDEIETQNHFAGERCLKMLKKFQTLSGDEATYVRLAAALKNTMQDSLITDISQFFPQDQESKSIISVSYTIKPTVKLDEMYACLSAVREDFELQKNNGKRKATVQVSYPQSPSQTNSPLCFELTSLHVDSVRVVEDVCIAAAVKKIKRLSITINYE